MTTVNSYNIQERLLEGTSNTLLQESQNPVDIYFEKLMNNYYELFLNVINHEELEEGYLSKSEIMYEKITQEYGYVLASNFINNIYKYGIQNNDLKVLLSILKLISNISNKNEINNFSVIAISLFSYNNVEIIDGAITCFAKWGRKEDAELLRNFKEPTEKWLKDYYNETILYLEGLE